MPKYLSDAPSESISSLDTNDDDFVMSTRPNLEDDNIRYGRMRTTAKKRGQYTLPPQHQSSPVRPSVLRNSFKDFEGDYSDEKDNMQDQDSSVELEVGRGLPRNTRATPSKLNQSYAASDVMLDMSNASPFDIKATPQPRSKQIRKSLGTEQDLRKNAQLRRASSQRTSGRIPSAQRIPAVSTQNTYTEESFGLPDLTGLSNIIDTAMDQKRPQVSKYRSRLSEGARPISNNLDQFVPVQSVPISDENKWQMLALQSLHERIKTLEEENAQLSHQCHEYKNHVQELEEELNVERTIRQADSALGSDDGKHSKKSEVLKLQVTNARLDATNRRLSRRVKELEEKADSSDNLTKRMVSERNKLARDLSVTQDQQAQKIRQENSILKRENKALRERVDELQVLNEELIGQLDNTRDRHDDETQNWTQREHDLERKVVEGDTAIIAENQTLHLELNGLKAKYDDDVQRLRKEAENRRAAARAAQAEYANLQLQNQQLRKDLQETKEKQEREQRRAEIKVVGNSGSQQRINEELRQRNDDLQAELAQLKAYVGSSTRREDERATRSRSKSASRRKSGVYAHVEPRAQSPLEYADSDDASERDSTTNLSRPVGAAAPTRTGRSASASRRKSATRDEADTYLSMMSPEEIMNIRKNVEEEYASRRARATSGGQSVTEGRRSSLKNTARPKTPIALNDEISIHSRRSMRNDTTTGASATQQQDTQQSRRSSFTSRRRTVNHEEDAGMTSAFIVPDITLNVAGLRPTLSTSARKVLSNLAPHSPRQCTVCHRIVSAQNPAAAPESPKITTPAPISTLHMQQSEVDATIRPSEPPLKALSRVIRQLADEIVHLKLELHTIERRLAAHDPAHSKRERNLLHEAIEGLNKGIQVKCDQIYSLYDVLEGHKVEIGNVHVDTTAEELEEDITEDVREILEELKAGRRVTIQSPPVSKPTGYNVTLEDESEDGDSERPWEGFSETASLASRRF
jgi:hypothetical protein